MFRKKLNFSIALLLLLVFTLSFLLSSCSVANKPSTAIPFVIEDYVSYLNARNYDAAYEFLSGSAQQQINRYSFEQKHEQYFNLLKIKNISWAISQSSDDPLHSMTYITFTYDSELCGTIENFQVVELIKQENKWRIEWTPQILHNDMDWYSTIRERVSKGKRGEIFASGKLVAANSAGVSILINPLEVEDKSQLISLISPMIGLSEEKITKKMDASILQAQVVVDRLRLRNKPTTDERSEVVINLGRGEVLNVLDDGTKHLPLPSEDEIENELLDEITSPPSVAQSNEEGTIPGFYRVEFKTSVVVIPEEEEETKKGFFEKLSSFFTGGSKENDTEILTPKSESDLSKVAAQVKPLSNQTTSTTETTSPIYSDQLESLPLLSDVSENIDESLDEINTVENENDPAGKYHFTGYVYAPYVRLKYSQDLILLKSFRADMIEDEVLETLSQIPGVVIDKESFSNYRIYPYAESMFHIIGYTGLIMDKNLKDHIEEAKKNGTDPIYDDNSVVGLIGVESKFEEYLREKDGYEVYISDENGSVKKMLYQAKASDGNDVHLTLDPELQVLGYDMLRLYLSETQTGSIYTMNPQTGAVSSMVSYPAIDPNQIPYMTSRDWAAVNLDEERAPLFNRVLHGSYIPGSILKPFTAVLGLEQGTISTDTVFPYQEFIEENRWNPAEHGDPSWNWTSPPIKRIENRFGTCDFSTSLRESDNIFFAWTAMVIGADSFTAYFENKLGFGEEIPFDMYVRPSSLFKPSEKNPNFNIAMLADSGYGQGQLIVTPLHAGTIFSAFANDGDAMTPYMVESIKKTEGLSYINEYQATQKIWKQDVISDEYVLAAVTSGLDDVMRIGTGKNVKSPYQLAGKTGTAQIGSGKELSWLVSYKSEGEKDFLASVTIEYKEEEIESKARFPITSSLFQYEYDKNSIEIDSSGVEVLGQMSQDAEGIENQEEDEQIPEEENNE